MNKNTYIILVSIFSILILSLFSAYYIEFVLGHKPCKLCIYQRYPYFISILLLINIFFLKKLVRLCLVFLSLISLFGSILAFYHFGIEQGFFSESIVCEAPILDENLTKKEILKQLSEKAISCKIVTFKVFGLSLASINTIFSFVLFCIFIKLFKNYELNR